MLPTYRTQISLHSRASQQRPSSHEGNTGAREPPRHNDETNTDELNKDMEGEELLENWLNEEVLF